MPTLAESVGPLAAQSQTLSYLAVYLATIFVGNVSVFIALWLLFKGSFGPGGAFFLFLTIVASYLSGDILWYSLGRKLRDTRLGNFIRNRLKQHEKIEAHIQRNGDRWIFVSKFLYASGFPILFLIGWSKVPFSKMLRVSVLTICLSLPILTGVTYGLFAGLAPLEALTAFRRLELMLAVGIALFLLINHFLLSRLIKKLLHANSEGPQI